MTEMKTSWIWSKHLEKTTTTAAFSPLQFDIFSLNCLNKTDSSHHHAIPKRRTDVKTVLPVLIGWIYWIHYLYINTHQPIDSPKMSW